MSRTFNKKKYWENRNAGKPGVDRYDPQVSFEAQPGSNLRRVGGKLQMVNRKQARMTLKDRSKTKRNARHAVNVHDYDSGIDPMMSNHTRHKIRQTQRKLRAERN